MSEQQEAIPRSVERVAETVLPTRHGTFRMIGYRGDDGIEHVSLSLGVHDGVETDVAPLVRLHSECLTGDALGSRRCDCGSQLQAALARIADEGRGVVVYIRGHEGRGIGLVEKLRAYHLQDQGVDTVDANLALGHPADARDYGQAAAILRDLGLTRIRLMSSNPAKQTALTRLGISVVERTGMFVPEFDENRAYLATKRERMSHDRPAPAVAPAAWTADDTGGGGDPYDGLTDAAGFVVAQMAQSLDGFIATRDGDSAGLSGPEDHRHLHCLRALADAVVVGWRTVETDDPQLTVREVPGEHPTRVVIDPHAHTPPTSRVFSDGAAPTLWLVATDTDPGRVPAATVVRLPMPDFDPTRLVQVLADRGLQRLLIEGGGRTVSGFLRAGALDRLYVTTVPTLLGDGIPGVRATPTARIADGLRAASRLHRFGNDVCTEFRLR